MSDIMTQEQIEEMLRNAGQVDSPAPLSALNLDDYLSRDEQDALGEMGNICMGTAATTMYMLLNKQVTITTPNLSLHTWETLAAAHPLPLVVVEVQYTEGITGNNLLLLNEYDVALITDLLMGGEGNIDPNNVVLDEISLSAIREVMNQMVGSSATSLAAMLNTTIDISTPESKRVLMTAERITNIIPQDGKMLKISFKMVIEGLLESEIMQVLPIEFAQKLAHELLNPGSSESASTSAPLQAEYANVYTPPSQDYIVSEAYSQPPVQQSETQYAPPMQQQAPPMQQQAPPMQQQAPPMQQQAPPMQQQAPPVQQQAPPMQQQAPPMQQYAPYPPSGMDYAQAYAPYPPQPQYMYPPQPQAPQPFPPYTPFAQGAVRDASSLHVREVEYPTFGVAGAAAALDGVGAENLWRLLDVPMEITVELGRSKKTVKQVLDLNVGAVVVLDKLAGELVEIMVNGIQVGRGEVVVIDDSYGVRITELNTKEIGRLTNGG